MVDQKFSDFTNTDVIPDSYILPSANTGVANYKTTYLGLVGYVTKTITVADTPYILLSTDKVLLVDASGGNVNIVLPDTIKSATSKRSPLVIKVDSGANNMRLTPQSGNVNGASFIETNTPYSLKAVTTDNTNWFVTPNASAGGSGDVVGPSSATANAVVRYSGTTGKLVKDSAVTIADTTGDILAGKYNTVDISGSSTPTLAITGTTTVSGANTGDQTITLTGNVTGSGTGSFTATIANNAVTFAKMQAVSANILLGNDASGTAVEEITCTAAGRALIDDADATAQRATLGVGAIGTLATIAASFGCVIGDGVNVITTNQSATIIMPFAMTITGWTIVECSDTPVSSSIVVGVWKNTYANYPPTVADTIAGSEKPTLSTGTTGQDLTLTTWTTTVTTGDIIKFNVESVTSAKRIAITVIGTRTT